MPDPIFIWVTLQKRVFSYLWCLFDGGETSKKLHDDLLNLFRHVWCGCFQEPCGTVAPGGDDGCTKLIHSHAPVVTFPCQPSPNVEKWTRGTLKISRNGAVILHKVVFSQAATIEIQELKNSGGQDSWPTLLAVRYEFVETFTNISIKVVAPRGRR